MRRLNATSVVALLLLLSATISSAQSEQQPGASVPRLINITGVFRPADGQQPSPVETVTLAIYADAEGGTPVWQETQNVTVDDRGRYSVVLGAMTTGGIPAEIFGSSKAHWLGTVFARTGEVEGARVRLTSVPYALRAAEADTLGGHPASDYLLATGESGISKSASATRSDVAAPAGTANFLPKYIDSINFGDSAVYESGGQVGLGTTTPFDMFHVKFTNTAGNFTGFAVQNMGASTTSYSGMLFFDQNNQLGQFQGFNNVTHEYRINNIARNGASQFDGSINFMIGSSSKFLVNSVGAVGIGTTSPSGWLEVNNPIGPTLVAVTTNSAVSPALGALISGQRSRGTPAARTAVLAGDALLSVSASGYGTTNFGSSSGAISMLAAENYTDTAHGSAMTFSTTANGTTTPGTRMFIGNSGSVGIGTTTPAAVLEVSNALLTSTFANVIVTGYGTSNPAALFVARKARGTSTSPTAVQTGDTLAGFAGRGYGATNFGTGGGSIALRASENWTDTAQGTAMHFMTTANGTATQTQRMILDGAGNLGIGTTAPSASLDVVRTGDNAEIDATTYNDGLGNSVFVAKTARGTQAAPAGVQLGDPVATFAGEGYGTTHFSGWAGGMHVIAAENWTDAATGTLLAFFTRALGASSPNPASMAIMPDGSVGIGTFTQIPTIADKLQVFGDARVGTAGTNGCLKRFDGTGLVGTCSSDRRFKKDITPFGPVLNQLTALQPVHYFWRVADFPERHFGNGRTYGLIAQDVEQVMPELVATDSDGYKAVDYSKLPLLTVQALKELKAENDELKQEVSELKRLMNELRASARR